MSYDDKDPANLHNMGVEAVMSADGGNTWPATSRIVLDHSGPNYDTGYPSSVQLEDGRLLTLYYVDTGEGRAPVDQNLLGVQTRMVIWRHPMQSKKQTDR
ncbi:MAG: exo-alpha-sialidase [Acidobacteria bacterium]|nr:exo-alpha-sialidase [Acidobacteriota bacterium]